MYQAERAARQDPVGRLVGRRLAVGPNVWRLGVTSLFTDLSSEMVASVLPAYLVLQRGLSPLAFGAIDGLYQGAASLARWFGGVAADRARRHKSVAAAGYALSAVSRAGLLAAGGAWAGIAGAIALDRIGKGLRTAPRDALISLSTTADRLGTAFGVHRALDTVGALLGPLAAWGILAMAPSGFDRVFVASLSAAVVGLAVLLLFVDNVSVAPAQAPGPPGGARRLLALPGFRELLIAAAVLSVATVSDGFLFLGLQRQAGARPEIFPLLALGTAASYLTLAIPAGWLADRLGRGRVFILGHVSLLGVYATVAVLPANGASSLAAVLLLGSYYAMTDGVLAAAASALLDPDLRGRGLALLGVAVSVSRLIASVAFGWLWTAWGREAAVAAFAAGLIVALILLMSGALGRVRLADGGRA